MNNHGKENVSVGSYTFPIEDLDKKILIEAFKLYDSTYAENMTFISESWWKELDNMLRLYGKKGMGFYYGYMMYLNQNKSGEELKNGDINPVFAPGYKVQEQGGAGTHRVGELDGVQMIEIEDVFGLATYEGSGDNKTQVEWSIIFDDMGEMKVGPTFIYDYKQYDLEPDEIDYWSIGGSNAENLLAVLLSFYRKYGDVDLITGRSGNSLYEEIDTEIKYAIDQQYRNDPEERKDLLDSLEFDPYKDRDLYVGGYKELQFDVEPRTLIDKLAQEKGYGRVVDEMLGGNGTAYFTSKGNVIKLTGDKSEYETANVIKGKQNKYIADVFESGKLDSSHIISGDAYIIIMEELGLPKRISETFEDCCCGVNKPIYIEYNETPAVIHPPVNGKEECEKLHKNLLMIRQELTQHGISWSDIGIDNLGMKNGKLALLDLGETTGGIDTGQTIELNEHEEPGLSPELEIGDVIKVVDIDREVENNSIKYHIPPPELRPEKFTPYGVVDKESNGSASKYPFRYTLVPEDELDEYERYEALHNNPLYQKKIGAKLLFPWVHQWIYADTPMANKVDRLTISENIERELNSDLGEDYIQEIVDKVYPHIVNKLGPSKYFNEPPTVELWRDIYSRISGIDGMEGEHSATSKAQFDDSVNVIYIYYPNMEDEEDVIKSLLHEYTHYLQDPDEREENRKGGYDLDPDEIASAKAELKWKDYLVYLEDRLNESGDNTSWSNDEDKITLQHILDLTEHIKVVDYPTEELSPIVLGWKDNPEEIERINQVEVSKQYPILIMVTKDDKLLWILDGNHRAQQALENDIPTIPAKLIKPSDLDERSIKMFFPKGIPSTKQTIELNEREQLELELPTPIGEFEFPVGYEDYTVDGKLYDGDEQESVDVIKDAVSNEAVTYLFKKWDKSGISFEDLKLLGIPTNNSLTRTMLVKRYLKNTYKNIPVSHEFDCDELADMFIKNPRDYSTDYIQKYLCADDSWMDYDGWYDSDWYDGMADGLDEQNWETIVKILKVPNKEIADNLINDRPQNEEEERMVNELEEEISEIKNSIVWGHNDESEYATKNAMAEDITDKLAEHFEGDGKLIQNDNGMFSWRIEGNLLDYLEDDMWDNTEVFQHHPDYVGATLEDWLQDITHGLPQSIFQALMLEEFTFLDYDYGKRGDLLEPETKWFDGYYHPDYDINQAVFDRLREVEYEFSSNSTEQLDEETDIFGQGLMDTIKPEGFEGSDEEWEELMKLNEPEEKEDEYVYTGGETDPSKGFVAPSKEVTDNICTVEGFCQEQGPITFGQLKALVEAATKKRIAADMGRGAFKTLWRIIPFFIPQILLAAVGVTATRAINKMVTPALKDTRGYKSWWGKVVLKAMDIAEGDYIPDVALGDDPLGKVFFVSDGLLQMIKDKYKLKFARYVADVASTRPDNEPVPDWFVENLLRDYLNQKFLLEPPLQPKKGIEIEDLKPTEDRTINEEYESERKFDKGELLVLKHVHKNFTKENLKQLTDETPQYGGESNKWSKLMKMFGIPTRSMEQLATSTQYAKYALDNWNEEGDYTMEYPKRNMIGWWDVSRDETGSQIEYKSGGTDVLAFNSDDAEERGDNEFHDWNGDMETVDWGDYEAYDSEIREVEPSSKYVDIPKISEGVAGDQEKHTGEQGGFFTLDGSDNIGNTDLYKDDGFDIIHQHRGNVHLSDISPDESETAIPQGTKKVKKTVLKPRLDKGPFNIPVKMNEHQGFDNVEDNPDLNPEVVEGDVIELIYMDDPYSIPVKTKGVVMGFEGKPGDFAYKILVNWIMGPESITPMALLPEADIYRFPKKKVTLNEQQFEKPYNDPRAVINGKEIQLDVADTSFLKSKGMMYKTSYPNNRGMLFLWDDIVPISMWMKNTFLPLDIIYMVDGEVVDYDKDVQPCEEQQCENYGNVNGNQALELVSGGVDNYNIKIGDKIELIDV